MNPNLAEKPSSKCCMHGMLWKFSAYTLPDETKRQDFCFNHLDKSCSSCDDCGWLSSCQMCFHSHGLAHLDFACPRASATTYSRASPPPPPFALSRERASRPLSRGPQAFVSAAAWPVVVQAANNPKTILSSSMKFELARAFRHFY